MSDTFPTLGLAFDLGEIAAGQAKLDDLKRTYGEVGAAAAAAAAQAGEANAALHTSASSAPSPLSGRATASANAAEIEKATLAQMVAETQAAVDAMTAIMEGGSQAQAAAAAAGVQAQIESIQAVVVATEAAAAQCTAASLESSIAVATAAQEAAAAQTASAEEAAAAALAVALEAARISKEQYAEETAAAKAAAAEAVALAEQAAIAKAAAEQAAQDEIKAILTTTALLQKQAYADQVAFAQAAAADKVAAEQAASAEVKAILTANTIIAAQAARDASAAQTAALAEVDAALEAQALIFKVNAQAQVEAQRQASAEIEAILTANALMQKQQQADVAASLSVNAPAGFMQALNDQVNALGKSKSALLEEKAALLGVTNEAAPFIANIRDSENALNNLGGGGLFSARALREVVVIMREIGRGDFSRLVGSASIELQALGALGPIIAALPFIAAAGAATAFALAMNAGAEQSAKFTNALALTNDYAGVTTKQLDAMSEAAQAATGEGLGQVDKAFTAVVASGHVAGDAVQYVGDAAVEMSRLTGESADKIASSYSKMFADPVKAMKELDDQYHFLTLSQYAQIESMAASGDKVGASTLLFKDLETWTKNETVAMDALGGVLHSITSAWNDLGAAIEKIGKTDPATRLKELQDQLKVAQAGGADPVAASFGAIMPIDQGPLKAQIAALEQVVNSTGAVTQATTAEKTAFDELGASLTKAKSNQELLTQAKDVYAAAIKVDAASKDPAAQARAAEALQKEADVYKQLEKEYDKTDYPTAKRGQDPTEDLTKQAAAIKNLMAQAQAMSGDDNNKDVSALMTKAAADARASAEQAGGAKAATAGQLAYNASVIAGLTAENQKIAADQKAIDSDKDKLNGLLANNAAMVQQQAITDAYYSSSNHSVAAYSQMLKDLAAAQLAATNGADALNIAQSYGVKTIGEISAAVQAELSNGGPVLAWMKAEGDAAQAEAEKHLNTAEAVNAQTEANKQLQAVQKADADAKSTIDDQLALAAAYTKGKDAIAEYNQKLQIKNELAKGGAGMTDADATAIVNQTNSANSQADENKITQQMQEQLRLSTETSLQRETSARAEQIAQALITESLAAGVPISREEAMAQAQMTAQLELQLQDAAKLNTTIKDSIRDGFAQTGKLDFTTFQNAITQSIRKSVYDALLAKPINMVVNATVDELTHGLQGILGQAGGAGGLLGSLGGLFGSGTSSADSSAAATINTGIPALSSNLDALNANSTTIIQTASTGNSLLSGIGAGIQGLPSALGPVFAGAIAGISIGGAVSSAVGITQNQTNAEIGGAAGAAIGAYLGGPVGAVIGGILGDIAGGLLGPGPSNNTASAQIDAQGNVTSVGGDKQTAATTAAITQVAGTIQPLIAQLSSVGIDAAGIITQIGIGVRDPSSVTLANGTQLRSATGDATALGDTVEKALLENAQYTNPALQALVNQMLAASDSMSEINQTLTEWTAGQQFSKTISEGVSQYTDPQAYQLQQLQDTQVARREQLQQYASEGIITPTQYASLSATLSTLESSEISSTISQFATTVGGATVSLQDYTDAQTKLTSYLTGLSTGALSPLSPQAQLASAQSTYQSDLAGAQGGNLTDLQAIQSDADTFLTDAQKFYGSSAGYGSIFTQVQSDLAALSTQVFTDPNAAATASAVTSLNNALAAAGVTSSTPTATAPSSSSSSSSSTLTPAESAALASAASGGASQATLQAMLAQFVALNANTIAAANAQVAATTATGATVAATTAAAVTSATALSGGLLTKASGVPVS